MKTKLFTIALFTLFINFAIAYAQNTENNCPPHYTRSAIKIPKVDIAKIEVVDSAKYSALPNLISKIDSLTPIFTNLYMEIATIAGIEGTVSFSLDINQSGKVEAAELTGQTGYSVYDNFARDFIKDVKFEPARINNEKVNSKIEMWIDFLLIDGIDKPDYIFDTLIYFERRSVEFAWQIIFSKTSIGEYIEYKNAERKITKKGEIPAGLFTKLSDFIISQCFLDYANLYSEYEGNPLYGVAITVNTGSLQKTVGSLGDGEGEPIGFWAISKLMLYINDQIKWEEVKE